jgi:hypothetical protein
MAKKLDKKTSEFIKIFESMGIKFIDIDTGEEIKEEE